MYMVLYQLSYATVVVVLELCLEADAVMVVWDDESEPAKTIRYKLISNLSHAKDVHIFNLSCF